MKFLLIVPLVASSAFASIVPLDHNDNNSIAPHAGHAGADDSSNPDVAQLLKSSDNQDSEDNKPVELTFPPPSEGEVKPHRHHKGPHPCPMKHKGHHAQGGVLHTKWIKISNAFRGAFGMPLIEMGEKIEGNVPGGHLTITTHKIMGGPGIPPPPPGLLMHPHPHHHGHVKGGHHWSPIHHQGSTFLQRIHVALMSLGPWEGRAVAFVLGCGLGVLLRMIFVLAVVTVRAIKGSRSSDEDEIVEYHHVIYEYQDDAEELSVPPPQYGYPVDEKAPVEESK